MGDDHTRDDCPSCGAALVAVAESSPVRCESCFAEYLRAVDVAFLEAYADFGCTSRRVVAEACLRELVVASPNQRKALAAAIFEQFVLSATDLIALYHAVGGRALQPIIQGFLAFQLDGPTTTAFFDRLAYAGDDEMLAQLGLPHPADVCTRVSGLDRKTAASFEDALRTLLRGLRRLERGPEGATALLTAQHEGMAVLVGGGTWEARSLDAHEVAALTLDAVCRRINVLAVSTDEHALEDVVGAIGECSAAARDLVFALLTLNDLGTLSGQPLLRADE